MTTSSTRYSQIATSNPARVKTCQGPKHRCFGSFSCRISCCMTHPNRKRKRFPLEREEAIVTRNRTTQNQILQRLTVVISTRQPPVVPNLKEGSSSTCHHTYKSLTNICRALGATVTAQVHAQVHCVIATGEALEPPPTQRVRKAWQRGIPVVTLAWLTECQTERTLLPLTSYLVTAAPSLSAKLRSEHKSAVDLIHDQASCSNTVQENHASALVTERVLDLGCCCACHDDDDAAVPTNCEWCVDCSVNRARHPVAASSS
jgi:hypothetical protein